MNINDVSLHNSSENEDGEIDENKNDLYFDEFYPKITNKS